MGDAILWMILWGLGAFGLTGLVFWLVSAVGAVVAAHFNKGWIAGVGLAVAVVTAAWWFIFALVNAIESLVTLIQIASGG